MSRRVHRTLAVALLTLLLGPATAGFAHAAAHRDRTHACALCHWISATPTLLPATPGIRITATWVMRVPVEPEPRSAVLVRRPRVRGPPWWTEPTLETSPPPSKERTILT
ncbi:MAG TPA: hypothetical protein VLV16_03470 [Gemmatimonadales bacterium]|nr:hypothetical protein [Gemmatimonadales bacterium]